jgi:drug/metabolite transporter (DMT)-like permease
MVSSRTIILLYMTGYLLAGAINTILLKSLDSYTANDKRFRHPYFQVSSLFLGEFSCMFMSLIVSFINRKRARLSEYRVLTTQSAFRSSTFRDKLRVFLFGIPAILFLVAACLMFLGLALSTASVYQMARGSLSVFVAIYSVVFLKQKIFRHQVTGIVLLFLGLVVVSASQIIYQQASSDDPIWGGIVLIISQVIAAAVLVVEEYLLRTINAEPLQATGVEGMCGFVYTLIILPVLYVIPCSSDTMCSNGRVEDSLLALEQLFSDAMLLLLWLGFMFTIALLYWTGIYTTKYASALARSTYETSRSILVWMFSILVGWEGFQIMQLAGFMLMTFGLLFFNEIIVFPYCGFREAVEKHKKELDKCEFGDEQSSSSRSNSVNS